MFFSPTLAIKLCLLLLSCGISVVCCRRFTSKRMLALICAALVWIGFMGDALAQKKDYCCDEVTLRVTGEKNDAAVYNQIWARGFTEGQRVYFPNTVGAEWAWEKYNSRDLYCYFPEGDDRRTPETAESVTFLVPPGRNRTVEFVHNQYGAVVEIICGDSVQRIDTYLDTDAIDSNLSVSIPDSSAALLQENEMRQLPWFLLIFLSGRRRPDGRGGPVSE